MEYLLKNTGKYLQNLESITFQEKEELPLMKYLLAYQAKSQMALIRKQMVVYAQQYGQPAAVAKYECHRNTISKWVNRFEQAGEDGLKDRSRAPHHVPHRIVDAKIIQDILIKRDDTGYSANRLKHQFDLKPSNMAINRILHEHDKIQPKKKKYKHKLDLWCLKQDFKTFETKLQMDAKMLTDIPEYYVFYKLLGLPKWQFTIRDVKSGATFISYMSAEDGIKACVFVVYVFEHLKKHGVDVTKITVQIDAASYATHFRSLKKTVFRYLIEDIYGAKLKIVPGGKTKQSDVETFHRLIEEEFYKRATFSSATDFYHQSYKYIFNFDFIRKNKHKDWQAPLYFLQQDRPETSSEVLDLPPIYLDKHSDLYWAKLNPKHMTLQELQILDLHPNQLPCSDFSLDETLDGFLRRITEASHNSDSVAHDVPIHPKDFRQ